MLRWVASCAALLLIALELIQGASAATGWQKLHRPLHLPHISSGAACPVSHVDHRVDWASINIFGGLGIGRGPVYPGMGSAARVPVTPDTEFGGPWLGGKVFWYVRPSYRGPVLIRGRQLNGTHRLGFNGRKLPQRELRIHSGETVGWAGQPTGSRGIASGIRVLVPGCYGVQIDGTRFSRVVIFRVTD